MSKTPEPDDFPEDGIVAELYLHIIFWIRKLKPALSPEMLIAAREQMDQTLFQVEGEALAAGGTDNHLHILARMSPNYSFQEVLDALRRRLTAWLKQAGAAAGAAWHKDEVAVSLGPDDLKAARKFIETQDSHHEIVSFSTELKGILDEHKIEYDERELWE